MLTRRALLSRTLLTGALTALGSVLGIGYSTAIEPKQIRVTRYRFTPERWPAGLRLRVALLADFHAHPRNMNEADLAAVVARTNALHSLTSRSSSATTARRAPALSRRRWLPI